MKNIINLLRRKLFTYSSTNSKVVYGRWNLDYDKSIQDRKVYLTNMDHCGCCEVKNDNSKSNKDIYDDDHLRPYFL
jgi:hypothetical protein